MQNRFFYSVNHSLAQFFRKHSYLIIITGRNLDVIMLCLCNRWIQAELQISTFKLEEAAFILRPVTQRCDYKPAWKCRFGLQSSLKRVMTFTRYLALFGKISPHSQAQKRYTQSGRPDFRCLTLRGVYGCLAVNRSLVPALWPSGSA